MQPSSNTIRRLWLPAVIAGHVAFLLQNVGEFLNAGVNLSGATSPLWSFSPHRIRVIQLFSTYEMLGRLCVLGTGITLLVLLARRDARWPRFAVPAGVAYLVFEVTLRTQYFFWGPPMEWATLTPYWLQSAAWGAAIVLWLVYVSRSQRVRATFDRDVATISRVTTPPAVLDETAVTPVMARPEKPPASWALFMVAHVAFLLSNAVALREQLVRHRSGDHGIWGFDSEQFRIIQSFDEREMFGRLCVLAVGTYLLALLARRDRRLPRLYIGYALVALVFEVAVFGMHAHWAALVGRASVAPNVAGTVLSVALAGVGLAYVSRPERRAIFVRDPAAQGGMVRLLLTLGAMTLLAWPFFVSIFTDSSQMLSATISPRGTTEADGAAAAILGVSLGGGLFLLMKHGLRMRARWVAILWPLGCVVVAVAYAMMQFGMYFRF